MSTRVVSVNVGRPTQVPYQGNMVSTGIFKSPAEGRVMLRTTNLDGDGQADPSVHGGPDMAAYAYSWEDYEWWMGELGHPLQPGEFGDNLTLSGLDDHSVSTGDTLRIGDALVQVTTPREPCFKLGIRMGDHRFPARFREARRMGFYVRVLEEGLVGAGDPVEAVARAADSVTIAEFHAIYVDAERTRADVERLASAPGVTASWQDWTAKRLAELG